MKGDITRETFRPQRHYWGVLRQQGRVDIDADWNEQVRIGRHHDITRTADLIGPSGGPVSGAGFELSVDTSGAVRISAGRYYVAGILAENEADVPLDAQPDPPGDEVPEGEGFHLAYLDVWDRHVTALDDPAIREVALGGPDTATRARTIWQVRTMPLTAAGAAASPEFATALDALAAATTDEARQAALQELRELALGETCLAPLSPVHGSLEPGTGSMAARSTPGDDTDELCRFGEGGGGYTRLENRLYRVEIHNPGNASTAPCSSGLATTARSWSRWRTS